VEIYFLQWREKSHLTTRTNCLYYGHRLDWSAFRQINRMKQFKRRLPLSQLQNSSFWAKSPGARYCTRHTCPLHAVFSFPSNGEYQDILQIPLTNPWTTQYRLNNVVLFTDTLTKLTLSYNAKTGKCTRISQCLVNFSQRSSCCYVAGIQLRNGPHCRHKNHKHKPQKNILQREM
jgi:hypothetical protein